MGLGFLGLFAALIELRPWPPLSILSGLAGVLLLGYGFVGGGAGRAARVRVTEGGITLDDGSSVHPLQVRKLELEGSRVSLSTSSGEVTITLDDERWARMLRRDILIRSPTHIESFSFVPRFDGRKVAAAVAGSFVAPIVLYFAVRRDVPLALASAPAVFVAAVPLFVMPRRVRVAVGRDGVRLAQLLKKSRFIPLADIERVQAMPQALQIFLRSGEVVVIEDSVGVEPDGLLELRACLAALEPLVS